MLEQVKQVVGDALNIVDRAEQFDVETPLLGHLPELDSMAVVAVITALEDEFDFVIDDDEISADTFVTLGSLVDFVERKTRA